MTWKFLLKIHSVVVPFSQWRDCVAFLFGTFRSAYIENNRSWCEQWANPLPHFHILHTCALDAHSSSHSCGSPLASGEQPENIITFTVVIRRRKFILAWLCLLNEQWQLQISNVTFNFFCCVWLGVSETTGCVVWKYILSLCINLLKFSFFVLFPSFILQKNREKSMRTNVSVRRNLDGEEETTKKLTSIKLNYICKIQSTGKSSNLLLVLRRRRAMIEKWKIRKVVWMWH